MERVIPGLLRAAARARPEAMALDGPDGALPYAALDRRVSSAACRLREAGVAEGGGVATYLPNTAAHVVLVLAVLRAGAVACPVSTRVPPEALAARLRQAGCRWLVTDDERAAAQDDVAVLASETLAPGAGADAEDGPGGDLVTSFNPDRPATLVFTSGSTGAPKAAQHSYGNHYYSARGSAENIALAPGDRWLLSLPLYHVGGLAVIFRCLQAGATVVLPGPRALDEVLAAQDVTHVSMVSTQLLRVLRAPAGKAGRLKAVLLGGGPLPDGLLDEAVARGLPVHTSYGLTEMASQVTATPPGAPRDVLRSAGRLLPYRALRVAADGEICVRGATLFQGYRRAGALERPFDAEGWYHTGDVGRLDDAGCLHVEGRRDNLFISGGENVQPEEIERALGRLEGVLRAVVVPVPDDEFGARPVAFVETAEDGPALATLAEHLAAVLPRFMIPTAFHPWPTSGADAALKPSRAYLRRRAADSNRM